MKTIIPAKKITAVFLCVILTLASCLTGASVSVQTGSSGVPAYVASSSEKAVWLDGCAAEGVSEIDAVKWYEDTDGVYYFFMPTSANVDSMEIYHNFSSVLINGKTVSNGEVMNNLPINQEFEITADGDSYTAYIMKSSSIASMFLTTESGSMDNINRDPNHETVESGQLLLIDSDGSVSYDGELSSIKGRGNTTWRNLEKKPYNIKLPKKTSLLGMKASKKWCLLANGQEHSMLRNRVAYDLADEVGLDYSPESRFLDLYANGEYLGSYQMTEKVDLGKNNLVSITDLQGNTEDALKAAGQNDDIESYSLVTGNGGNRQGYSLPVNPDDITGGYLIEYVVNPEEPCHFITSTGQSVDLKTVNSIEQVNYIADFVQDMEDALYSSTGYNSKGKYYTDYIDIESAALMYLLEELSVNIDTGISSCFFYKDSDLTGDGKLHAAPVWDYDVAFGNLNIEKDGVSMLSTDKVFAGICKRYNTNYYTVIAQLAQHEDLVEEAARLWNERFVPAIEILNGSAEGQNRLKSFDEYSQLLEDSAKMNYTRWELTDSLLVPAAGTTHESQLEYYINWVTQRISFMNELFVDVTELKAQALAELESYKNDFNSADYAPDNWSAFLTAYQNGVDAINSAGSNLDIQNELTRAKENMRAALGWIYVYYDNSKTNWDEVYIFWWGVDEDDTYYTPVDPDDPDDGLWVVESANPNWPGYLMTDCGNGVWKYKLDNRVQKVIFSNGRDTAQTDDLTFPGRANRIFVPDADNVVIDPNKGSVYIGSWKQYSLVGDVDLNGKVNLLDAILVQKVSLKLTELDGQCAVNADYNGDGKISLADAILIQKVSLNLS